MDSPLPFLNAHQNRTGHLTLIVGPMWAGKTSALHTLWSQLQIANIPCLCVNHDIDGSRFASNVTESPTVSTHNGSRLPCVYLSELMSLLSPDTADTYPGKQEFDSASVCMVNEAQFFPDVVEFAKIAVEERGKALVLAGLDSDFLRRPWPNMWLHELLPLADVIEKKTSWCAHCKKMPALFSFRKARSLETVLVGSSDSYIPVCRQCWTMLNPQ